MLLQTKITNSDCNNKIIKLFLLLVKVSQSFLFSFIYNLNLFPKGDEIRSLEDIFKNCHHSEPTSSARQNVRKVAKELIEEWV